MEVALDAMTRTAMDITSGTNIMPQGMPEGLLVRRPLAEGGVEACCKRVADGTSPPRALMPMLAGGCNVPSSLCIRIHLLSSWHAPEAMFNRKTIRNAQER